MARILVTGGAGYVGSVCCTRLLEHGHSVAVIDDLSSGHAAAIPHGATLHQIDIGDRSGLATILRREQFEAVFHFAAKALIPESVVNPGVFFDSNVASGVGMLETLRAAGVRKFVFSSSAAVYGSPSTTPIPEGHAKSPVNAYGESKLIFENILDWYAKAYQWGVVAFRYFNACGATATHGECHDPETHLIPRLLRTARGENPIFEIFGNDYPTPDGTCKRDFVHVEDIADAHIRALEILKQPDFRAYNIGTGNSYSILEVCRAVERITKRQLNVKVGPRRPGDPAELCADPRKILQELGWAPRRSSLPEVIQSAWFWMTNHSVPAPV